MDGAAEPTPTSPGQLAGFIAALDVAGVPVTRDPGALASAGVDWTGAFRGEVLTLVRPTSTEQVALTLGQAAHRSIPIQVQGGNTGLVGGSVPADDLPAVVLSTTGLGWVGPLDPGAEDVSVGAGTTCATVQRAAASAGRYFAVDLAARDSATIGGMVATNAGGIRVCAYGMMREQVLGLTAVLADGRVVRTGSGLVKDNTGYDLRHLLIGSEGTLGVLTEVTLRLRPSPPASSVGLVGVSTLAAAADLARHNTQGPFLLLAAEVIDAAGLDRVCRLHGWSRPPVGAHPWYLLLEVADQGTLDGLAGIAELDAVVAATPTDRARLWAFREDQALAYADAAGPAHTVRKFDVSVPLDALDLLVDTVREGLAQLPGMSGWGCFGHVLDGNLHIECWGTEQTWPACSEVVLRTVADLHGSISAEHGIGRLKAAELHRSRSAIEIEMMQAIRGSLDPGGLLNRGVLLNR